VSARDVATGAVFQPAVTVVDDMQISVSFPEPPAENGVVVYLLTTY
jgi:hypothetical protein